MPEIVDRFRQKFAVVVIAVVGMRRGHDVLDAIRHRIAASIACHAAIKINTPLEQHKMERLLAELAKTE